MTLNEIIVSVESLKEEYRMNSIDPSRLGGIMLEILQYINSSQVRLQSPAIQKVYLSVSAMQSDGNPVSDLNGLPLRVGQLVCIVPASQQDTTAGDVYRYDGPSGNTSAWTYLNKIGGLPADQSLNKASTNPIANAPVASAIEAQDKKVAQLSQEWQALKDAEFNVVVEVAPHIEVVNVQGGAAILEPDKIYDFGESAQIVVGFKPQENPQYAAQYAFQFKSPSDAPTSLTMPEGVIFPVESDSSLQIKAGLTYQITIVDNLAVATSWEV